jgi:hypothetical protein
LNSLAGRAQEAPGIVSAGYRLDAGDASAAGIKSSYGGELSLLCSIMLNISIQPY